MPIQVKTMRDVWDRLKKTTTHPPHPLTFGGPLEMKKYKIFPLEGEKSKLSSSPFAVAREIEKYYLEYLARKKAFSETKDEMVKAFAEYEKKLGGAGFSKI